MKNLNDKIMKMQIKAENKLSSLFAQIKNEKGEVNVIAIVLLIVIAVALIAIFWKFILGFITDLMDRVTGSADGIGSTSHPSSSTAP